MSDERERPTDNQRRALVKLLLGNGSAPQQKGKQMNNDLQQSTAHPSSQQTVCSAASAARRAQQAKLHLYKAALLAECRERSKEQDELYWHIRNAIAALNEDSYAVEQCR